MAVLAEQPDEWDQGRRSLGLNVLTKSRLNLIAVIGNEVITDPAVELSARSLKSKDTAQHN